MNDKELLTLAAKAAGLYVTGDWEFLGHFGGLRVREDDNPGGYRWHPLTDDGDALRLAVKLGISVEQDSEVAEVSTAFMVGRSGYNTTESYGPMRDGSKDDPYAATRRAIVRAAAAMAG